MSVPVKDGVARDEGGMLNLEKIEIKGPVSEYPKLELAPESEPSAEDAKPSPVSKAVADLEGQEPAPRDSRLGGWLSNRWNNIVGHMSDAAFVTGLLGSGLGQLSYWTTMFPFAMALSFALTFELAMVGISRRVRQRRIKELPAGALHFIGWLAALGAAGWNLIHLSDPNVVVRFSLINGGEPLFHGGQVVGWSFATIALLGFLIHEQSEKYHVEDALAGQGKKIQRIGPARVLNYPSVSWAVWRNKVADPSLDVDAEFLRVLSAKRGQRVLSDIAPTTKPSPVVAAAKTPAKTTVKANTKTPSAPKAARARSEEELNELVDAVLEAERKSGERLGFRRLQPWLGLTQADARTLRSKADKAAEKQLQRV